MTMQRLECLVDEMEEPDLALMRDTGFDDYFDGVLGMCLVR